jgi:Mat/Ecp fimbriae major subunit
VGQKHFSTYALAAAVLLVGIGDAADAASGPANGRARTLRPIALSNTRALDFGTLVTGATAGTVTVNARTDARTRTGGVTLLGGAPGAARFTATGTPAVNAFITIGTAPVLIRG